MRLLGLIFCLLLALTGNAHAQGQGAQVLCLVPGSGAIPNWQPCSSTNPLYVAPGNGANLSVSTTSALAKNLTVKATAGSLYGFQVSADSTLSAAAWWVMIFNASSPPGDSGTAVTPTKCYALPSGATALLAAWPAAIAFSTGIVIAVSTTGCFVNTASTHAFISADYQ